MKLADFLSLVLTHPREAYGRLEGIFDRRLERFWIHTPSYQTEDFDYAIAQLSEALEVDLVLFSREQSLVKLEEKVRNTMERIPPDAPFPRALNGDFRLAKLCYVLCRALKAKHVVETGVCYGVTTSFLLQAMHENGQGKLHSIDLPPLGKKAGEFVGILVPSDLRKRWVLYRGTSKSWLPQILKQIGEVDFFIHDSLHTSRNMTRELMTITPFLSRPSLVVSDDIEGNNAFGEWVDDVKPAFSAVLQQSSKLSKFGLAAFAKLTFEQMCASGKALSSSQ